MKTCTRCKQNKYESQFTTYSEGKRKSRCKSCLNELAREHYKKNDEYRTKRKKKIAINNRRWRQGIRAQINQIKKQPCIDCGETHIPFVMDFHHRDPESKLMTVCDMTRKGFALEKILAEIAKCDL